MQRTENGQSARLNALVVTFNRLDQLQVTVARLLDSPAAELERVLVFDNASTDGTREWLDAQSDPRLEVVHNPVNLGGAGGFEAGMRLVHDRHDPDWLLIMDDDARPEPGALAAFHARLSEGTPDFDGLATAVRYPAGGICEMNRPWLNPFWHPKVFLRVLFGGGRAGYHMPDSAFEPTAAPCEIDGTSFVGLFVSRKAMQLAGFPPGNLFIYGDDVLYTLAIRKAGLKLTFDPTVRYEHDFRTFSGGTLRVYKPLWKVYYNYRNGLLMYHEASGPLFWPLICLLIPKWFRLGRHYTEAQRPVFRRLLKLAIRDALLRDTHRSHAEIQALARVPGED
ncbi:glycosyltransferase [Paenirhodobacter enshiensis]|uniref:glycosyltransferase n=1 Tax=Paenirhodobacter enshiensis TaxID=1105367 RepID=UPI0035AF3675